jgi:predicted NodU family carbamoyl transferase
MAHGLERLHKLVCKQTILPLLERCLSHAKLHGAPVRRLAAGGNTTMMHLFLALPPKGLGEVPFNAVTLAPSPASGTTVGLPVERVEVRRVEHHLAHLASAFFPSPFEEAALCSVDGFGDFASAYDANPASGNHATTECTRNSQRG